MSDSNQISKSDADIISESQLKRAGALVLAKRLPKDERSSYLTACDSEAKDPVTIFVISLFLGGLGVDRFVLGQTIIGIVKLLTLAGCGLWWFIDLFLIMGATKEVNAAAAYRIYCQLRD